MLGRSDLGGRASGGTRRDERAGGERAAERLATEQDSLTRTALAISLLSESSAARVPTAVVVELVENGGAAAALAAKALASRDSEAERPQIERLSKSGDPLIRAHIALGLADSREASAVGLLREIYRFEQDADVRHAVVTALSRRSDRSRLRTLELAADLDGDERVRSAARLSLKGARLSPLPRGRSGLWLTLAASGEPRNARPRLGSAPRAERRFPWSPTPTGKCS